MRDQPTWPQEEVASLRAALNDVEQQRDLLAKIAQVTALPHGAATQDRRTRDSDGRAA